MVDNKWYWRKLSSFWQIEMYQYKKKKINTTTTTKQPTNGYILPRHSGTPTRFSSESSVELMIATLRKTWTKAHVPTWKTCCKIIKARPQRTGVYHCGENTTTWNIRDCVRMVIVKIIVDKDYFKWYNNNDSNSINYNRWLLWYNYNICDCHKWFLKLIKINKL